MNGLLLSLIFLSCASSYAMESTNSSTNATEMESFKDTYMHYQQGMREQDVHELSDQERTDIVEQAQSCYHQTWHDINADFKKLVQMWKQKYNFAVGDTTKADDMLNAAINSSWSNKNRYQLYLNNGGNSKEDFVFNYLRIQMQGRYRQIREGFVPEDVIQGRNDAIKYFLRRVGHKDSNALMHHNGFYICKPNRVTESFKTLLEAIVNKESENCLQSRSYILGIMLWLHTFNRVGMSQYINNNELIPGLPIETDQLFKDRKAIADVSILHRFAKDIARERDFMAEK